MKFIPILLLAMFLGSRADLMNQDVIPSESSNQQRQTTPMNDYPRNSGEEKPKVVLTPDESVKVAAEGPSPSLPTSVSMEEQSPPGRAGANCLDCAAEILMEPVFSIKVPKLNINFEVKDFPSSKLIFANLAQRINSVPFVKSFGNPNEFQRLQLKSLGQIDVHISIPKFGWNQIFKLSDVVSGFKSRRFPP
uniref:2b protein n=1 Tax=Bacopa chlorosis virus TaxID=593888 RepID=B9VV83_9BROM|nr:2b protein [Bacopa chlorosis virus]